MYPSFVRPVHPPSIVRIWSSLCRVKYRVISSGLCAPVLSVLLSIIRGTRHSVTQSINHTSPSFSLSSTLTVYVLPCPSSNGEQRRFFVHFCQTVHVRLYIRHLTRRPRASKHSPVCQNARDTVQPSCRQASWRLFPQIAPGGRSTRRGNGAFTGRRLQSVATPSIAASTAAWCYGSLRQPAWRQSLVGEHRRDKVPPWQLMHAGSVGGHNCKMTDHCCDTIL